MTMAETRSCPVARTLHHSLPPVVEMVSYGYHQVKAVLVSAFRLCHTRGPSDQSYLGMALDLADRQLYALVVEVVEEMTRSLLRRRLLVKALLRSKAVVHKV